MFLYAFHKVPQILFLDTIGVNKKKCAKFKNGISCWLFELKLRQLSILKCESILRCKCIFILNENWKAKNLFISSSNCLLVPEIGMSNWNGFNIAVCRIFMDNFIWLKANNGIKVYLQCFVCYSNRAVPLNEYWNF